MNKLMKTILTVLILPLTAAICLVFSSGCDILSNPTQTNSDPLNATWYAYNVQSANYYSVKVTRVYAGNYCTIYVEDSNSALLNVAAAQSIADEFDTNVYPKIVAKFGSVPDVDNNGKVTILILDIIDGSSGGEYVAGYFDPNHELDNSISAKKDILFMDCNPGNPGDYTFNYTMAHELQHMINFNQKYFVQGGHYQDRWIDEGLSSAAETVYLEDINTNKVNDFNNDSYGYYRNGKNFLNWEGVYANYVTVYLFFQWLRIQSSIGDNMFKYVINNSYDDYRAVESVANTYLYTGTWHDFFRDWLIARFYNNPTGVYGYKGIITNTLSAISVGSNYYLRPGESIVAYQMSNITLTNTSRIDFSGLHTINKTVSNTSPYYGNRLLVYNYYGISTNVATPTGTLPSVVEMKGTDGTGLSAQALQYKADIESGKIKRPIDVSFDRNGNSFKPKKK